MSAGGNAPRTPAAGGLRSAAEGVGRLAQGLSVVLRQMFRRPVTQQYPRVLPEMFDRTHIGRHRLNRHENGLEKCIGCELCAWACPADAIFVRGMDNPKDDPISAGERCAEVYQINYLRCIMCGLCVEACPTRALTLTPAFEMAFESREDAIYEKDQLLAEPLPVTTAPGTEEGRSMLGNLLPSRRRGRGEA